MWISMLNKGRIMLLALYLICWVYIESNPSLHERMCRTWLCQSSGLLNFITVIGIDNELLWQKVLPQILQLWGLSPAWIPKVQSNSGFMNNCNVSWQWAFLIKSSSTSFYSYKVSLLYGFSHAEPNMRVDHKPSDSSDRNTSENFSLT